MQDIFSKPRVRSAHLLAAAVIASITACGGGRRDATAAADSLSRGNPVDTASEVRRTGDTSAVRPPVTGQANGRSSDSTFLVQLANHHEALLELAQAAESKSQGKVKSDAREIISGQRTEQRQILQYLQSNYHASYQPQTMAQNGTMNDSLSRLSGNEYARSFYAMVVRHYQEGLRMIDSAAPSLTDSTVRALSQKLKEKRTRDIEALRRKTTAAT